MSDYPTLLQFLEQSGARVHVYDIGRRVGALSHETFLDFEHGNLPYPCPMQHKAWIALVQIPDAKTEEPVIWFLRLDLDEQGLLVQAERDYLLSRLLESAQAQSQGADPQVFLQDNPYAFSPREERMALFHARLSADLDLPPSRYYAHALDYFRGQPGWDQWSFVGYQGIADVACRHSDQPLTAAIAHLPNEPLVALCHCLESGQLDEPLRDALLTRLQQALSATNIDINLIAALVRSLSSVAQHEKTGEAFQQLLDHPCSTAIELLAALSGRAWEALREPKRLDTFLVRLAENDHGQAAFEQCIGDLLSLPVLTEPVRQALRDPEQSTSVRTAFERMLTVDTKPGTGD